MEAPSWRTTAKKELSKSQKMLKIIDQLYEAYWNLRQNKYGKQDSWDFEKLRLVLGVGRSGTTWVANTLARTSSPVRYFEEPLHHIKPKIRLSSGDDHTCADISPNCQRLITAYKLLCSTKICPERFLAGRFFKKNDESFKYVLVKEVHTLFASRHIVEELKVPVVFIRRDITTVLDSIFNAQGIQAKYLKDEFQLLEKSRFLGQHFSDNKKDILTYLKKIRGVDGKRRIYYSFALIISLIQLSFVKISNQYSNAVLVDYESLIENPDEQFKLIADFFSFTYQPGDYDFGRAKDLYQHKNYSISRDTKTLADRKYKFFTENEANEVKEFTRRLYQDLT